MKVYVLDCNGKPLMPTSRGGRVRWLLKTRRLFMYNQRRNITPIPPTAKAVGFLGV